MRTYVQHKGDPGIYFLAEWLSNPLSVHLGPGTFGLPYRFGKIDFRHTHEKGELSGTVAEAQTRLEYGAKINSETEFDSCAKDSLEEFLMERYTAFTQRGTKSRFFRIWHPPWRQTPIEIKIVDDNLLTKTWPWFKESRMVGANFSPGVFDVWMGRPVTTE